MRDHGTIKNFLYYPMRQYLIFVIVPYEKKIFNPLDNIKICIMVHGTF